MERDAEGVDSVAEFLGENQERRGAVLLFGLRLGHVIVRMGMRVRAIWEGF